MLRKCRWWAFLLLVLLITAGGLFAAGQAEEAVEVEEVEGFHWRSQEGAVVTILANQHPWVEIVRPKIGEFEDLTGIRINLDVYPEDQFRTRRTVEMVSGTSVVDVFMLMPGNALDQYHTNNWVSPLNDLMNNEDLLWPEYDLDDFYPAALESGVRDGNHYTVPLLLESSVLAYNKEIFDRYGVEVPETMEELETAARKIYEESGGDTYGITLRGARAAATSQWVGFLYSFGGAWTDENGDAAIDSPEAIEAFEFYGRLLREYGPPGATANSWYESNSLFQTGEAAMVYDANVFRPNFEDPEQSSIYDKVGYAPLPAGPAGSIPHVSNWGLALNANSEAKEAAWLFMQWATSKDMALEGQLTGMPSARRSAWESPEFRDTNEAPDWAESTQISYERGQPQWNPPVINIGEARDAVGEVIVAAILGDDVSAAARRAARDMQAIIDEERQ